MRGLRVPAGRPLEPDADNAVEGRKGPTPFQLLAAGAGLDSHLWHNANIAREQYAEVPAAKPGSGKPDT